MLLSPTVVLVSQEIAFLLLVTDRKFAVVFFTDAAPLERTWCTVRIYIYTPEYISVLALPGNEELLPV